jgi:hypothetical protein
MEASMSRLSLTAAGALLFSVVAVASTSSVAAQSRIGISAGDAATSVCLTVNEFAPAQVVKTVEDGLGDFIVWVRDKDGDLWLCNASAEGNVYVNKLIRGDLLAGAGKRAISIQPVAHTSSGAGAATDNATRLCEAAGRHVDARRVVATTEDGVGDRIVWLRGGDNSYWLCNASAEAKLFVFERVSSPINAGAAGPDFRAT